MPNYINLLPEHIANQIAAGEVVQRPASVVKELLENAIDAGATTVQLIIKDAGKALIQVIDNGKGMSEADAVLCFARHATSKIKNSEDLFKIQTMGFRGEALASIAAVCQVELKTKQAADEVGTLVCIEGSDITRKESVACAEGTSIAVKNIFYNVPARRNFLKSNTIEFRHIQEEFIRIALSHPGVQFTFYNNENLQYKLTAGKLSQRIVEIFGNNYKEQLAPCSETTEIVKIQGYIGKPASAKKTRGEQYFFVNNRYIRSYILNNAVIEAYEGLLSKEVFPFYLLQLEIDPTLIDINVHPTKSEIKFADDRAIYAILKASIRKSLSVHNFFPSLNFDAPMPAWDDMVAQQQQTQRSPFVPPKTENNFPKNTQHFQGYQPPPVDPNLKHWNKLFDENTAQPIDKTNEINQGGSFTLSSSIGTHNKSEAQRENIEQELPSTSYAKQLLQLNRQWIVSPAKSGMLIIHQQRAHYRICFEKLLNQYNNQKAGIQQLMFPVKVPLTKSEQILCEESEEVFQRHGFQFEQQANEESILITGVPTDYNQGDEASTFFELLNAIQLEKESIQPKYQEIFARTFAKRMSIKVGKALSNEEMADIVARLFSCSQPGYTPEGESTLQIISYESLEGLF